MILIIFIWNNIQFLFCFYIEKLQLKEYLYLTIVSPVV